MRAVPSGEGYSKPYIANRTNRPRIVFICYLETPKGRISKNWQSISIYMNETHKKLDMDGLVNLAKDKLNFDSFKAEFKRGCTKGELFIHQDTRTTK